MAVKVFVKTLTGETLTFIFTEEEFKRTRVLQLKTKITQTGGIPGKISLGYRLSFNGRELEDQRLLSDCGVKPEDTIHMIPGGNGAGVCTIQ
uniref:Ubiquitin-like domain-containing protein n=1 Tax=Sparus aurata TaxID=8175 RepID=A0A671V2I2_SPAAU